jgi:hypothetical protein
MVDATVRIVASRKMELLGGPVWTKLELRANLPRLSDDSG